MKQRPDSYCGIYCGACPQSECLGCKVDHPDHHSPDCTFMACAREKGVEFCSECEEYPCTALREFNDDKWAHHSTILPNLETIRSKGHEAWLEEQKKRWSCPSCGAGFTWYDKQCTSCKQKVQDCTQQTG